MALPLFFYPTTWLWLDDDRNLLDTMTMIFGEKNAIKSFQSATACLAFLKDYQPPHETQPFIASRPEDEEYGTLRHTPTDLDVTKIMALASNPNKSNEISVMVIDYSMPEMTGFEFAQQLSHLPIQKLLLTGEAQHTDAICGFNKNLIQRYVQKGTEEMGDNLATYLHDLTLQYFQQQSASLLAHLEAEILLPLSDPTFIQFFQEKTKELDIKEFYLIDKQGSFLCIDGNQNQFCLVVYSEKQLQNWLTLYGQDSDLSNEALEQIRHGKSLPFFGLKKEAWEVETDQWSKYLFPAEMLPGRETYYWACIKNNEKIGS